jgi:tRNA-dihydrouridine synthase B
MAGYTDAAFRSVCARWGASLCFAEMVSAEALSRGSAKTLTLLTREPEETASGFQIFACDARSAAAAVRLISPLGALLIDLNCGCSVPKVLKTGCGAALLRSPALIGEIVRAMRGETSLPVTVKLRSGWDPASVNYLSCAEAAVAAGASAVTLHPRTRSQGFSGKSRWEEITALRAAIPVPVLGSGDLFTPQDCLGMLRETGCHGIMVARGALGNPFIFRQTAALLRGEEPLPVTPAERLETAMRHLTLLARARGEALACREMRKHFVAYTRGMEGGAALRQAIVTTESAEGYAAIVRGYLEGHRGISLSTSSSPPTS